MTTNEERLKILTMLQEGKIDTAEAARLLEALESSPEPEPKQKQPETTPLHIKVTRLADNKPIADISTHRSGQCRHPLRPNSRLILMALTPMLARDAASPEPQQIIDVTDEEKESMCKFH